MVRSKSYKKNIVCLESLWDHDLENRRSVLPLLELTSKTHQIKSVLLTSNTVEEFRYNLELAKNKKGYGVLYLAFHGKPGKIVMNKTAVAIEAVAELMGRGFSNRIVHFDCCATMKIEKRRVVDFMLATGVLMVLGYKNPVDWAESAAMDLLLLDWIQRYKDMRIFWDRFRKAYRNLIRVTGLEAFFKEF